MRAPGWSFLTGLGSRARLEIVKRVGSYALLAVCAFLTYQSYENSRQRPETEELAKRIACDVDSQCILQSDRARFTRTDPIRRRYQFQSSVGPLLVTCKREMLWLGAWGCTSEKGSFLEY